MRIFSFISSLILICSCSTDSHKIIPVDTDFCKSIHRNDSVSLSAELADLTNRMKNQTGVYVLEDGAGSMVTRAWLTEYAEKTIDVQYFIFSMDNVGLIACDYLVRAADRGVKVRLLIDDIMVDADAADLLTLDSHDNISIRIYNPGMNIGKNIFGKLKTLSTDFRSANQRMHNKTFIIDHKLVITGGRNIADEYFDYDHEYNFRDRDVLLLGEVTGVVRYSFDLFWNHALSVPVTELVNKKPEKAYMENRYDRLHEYACDPENFWPQVRGQIEQLHTVFPTMKSSGAISWLDSVQFISDLPGKNDGSQGLGGGGVTTDALIKLVESAEESIDIQTPYLITTDAYRALFKSAVDRGVHIRILTNSLASTDNVEAFSSYQTDRKKLLDTRVEIYEYRPDAEERMNMMTGALHSTLEHIPIFGLHAKSMVIDGYKTVIGTFNLDPRSANLNTECLVIIDDAEVAEGVLKGMNIEFESGNSWRVTQEFNPDKEVSRAKRLKTWTRKILPKEIL